MQTFDFRALTPEQWDAMTVIGSDGDKIGRLADVYLDHETGEPEWALVTTGLFGNRTSFVPLAGATIEGEQVQVPYDKALVKDAPNAEPDGELSDAEEEQLYTHYGFADFAGAETTATGTTATTGETGGPGHDTSGPNTDSAMTRSEEEADVRTARRPRELVRLRKTIVTEPKTVTVPVSREEVRVEREPITEANIDAALDGPELSEEQHEVTLMEEEVTVEKRVVPKERVRVDKDVVTGEAEVDVELRKEQIDIERS